MQAIPQISVQIVHIQGPLKGEIQEFADPEIWIGRHPSCHIRFPKDLAIISRKHAVIEREGNRFKLIDKSANGTYVNGKPVEEIYLKNGDVLVFAEGGPKVSFLTKMLEKSQEVPRPRPSATPVEPPRQKSPSPAPDSRPANRPPQKTAPPVQASSEPPPAAAEKTQAPLIIQYGPTLQSFKELPVTIGQDPSCDFVLPHAAIESRHARISFRQGQYWIEDLTGKGRTSVDNAPISRPTPLQTECRLSLSPSGPHFRFFGAGRLAEIEEPVEEPDASSDSEAHSPSSPAQSSGAPKPGGLFKKFFKG